MKFYTSRWNYWWAYLLIFALAMLSLWFNDRAYDASSWLTGVLAVVILAFYEFRIRKNSIKLTSKSLEIKRANEIKTIDISSISEVSLTQSVPETLLRYGKVYIKIPGEEFVVEIGNASKLRNQLAKYVQKIHKGHTHPSLK